MRVHNMFTQKGGDKGKAAKSKKERGGPKLVEHSVWLCVDDKRLRCCVHVHTYFWFLTRRFCGVGCIGVCLPCRLWLRRSAHMLLQLMYLQHT